MKHKKRGQIFKGRERERRGEKKAVGTGIALEKSAEHPCLLGMNSNISFSSFTPLSLSLSLSPSLSFYMYFIIIHASPLPLPLRSDFQERLPYFITYYNKMKMGPIPIHAFSSSLYISRFCSYCNYVCDF